MIQLKFRQFQTDSEDDSAMIQKGIFHEGAKQISAFVFATRIVQSLSYLNQKFQASSHLV